MSSRPYIRFDSADPTSSWNRAPRGALMVIRCDSTGVTNLMDANGAPFRTWQDPIAALAWLSSSEARRFDWLGFLSYDLGRWFERLPALAADDTGLPLFAFTAHEPGGLPLPQPIVDPSRSMAIESSLRSTFSRAAYEAAVEKVIEYIAAGDVFQVNLSQRFSLPMTESPQAIYSRLREQSPAAYGGLLDFGDFALICNSPELFVKVTPDRRVITRPIKGTRPRSPGMLEELRNSIKDQAELNMIVDLERNDLGRVCDIGTVRVSEPRTIESHPTVHHGVATIEGTLRKEITFLDLLCATFPGGSITGAPKIRAMQIIEELEPVRRGPYCGAIGYLAKDGTIELNIAIRTMIAKDGLIHIPVGGGIVVDSDPRGEYEETLVKASAMFAALGISLPG